MEDERRLEAAVGDEEAAVELRQVPPVHGADATTVRYTVTSSSRRSRKARSAAFISSASAAR